MDLEARHFLAYVERIARDNEEAAEHLEKLYAATRPRKPLQRGTASRARDIADLFADFA